MFAWLARRRAYHALVDENATLLIERDGNPAYYTARKLARLARERDDEPTALMWGAVARTIADRTGKVIGKMGRPESDW